MQVNGWHSDRTGERRWHAAIPMFLAAAALLGLTLQPQSMPLSLTLFTAGRHRHRPICRRSGRCRPRLLSQSTAAAAVGMINAVGSVAGFAGPYLFGYLNTRTGSFSAGLGLMMVAALAGGLLMLRAPRSGREAAR